MGKHFLMKHLDNESHEKQPGCMWGLVHVLDYHHWQSNVRKMIQHRKYDGRTHDKGKQLFEQLVSPVSIAASFRVWLVLVRCLSDWQIW